MIYHPNIDSHGKIHLKFLSQYANDKEKWTPQRGIKSILLSVQQILKIPDLENAINIEAAEQYKNDREIYNFKVKE